MFWDSSALVALLVAERESGRAREWAMNDPIIVVSFISPIEITSALARRGQNLQPDLREQLEQQLLLMASNWIVVNEYDQIVQLARTIARQHALRSGDAIQLAAARSFARDVPDTLPFVTLDHELAVAARAEGFPVVS